MPLDSAISVSFRSVLRATFRHVVAAVYTAGTVFHLVRIAIRLDLRDMPFFPDVIITVLGTWGVIGMILFASDVDFRGRWEAPIHWLITLHLVVSVALHAWILAVRSHEAVAVFGIGYSYFGALYFGFFAWRSWTMRLHANPES